MTGPVQIRREDVIEDIRALAELKGVSMTEAVGSAVKAQLAAERSKTAAAKARRLKKANQILERIRSLPRIGPDLTDDDLYDVNGLPR